MSQKMSDGVSNNAKCGPGSFAGYRDSRRPFYVIGPAGDVITLADLPSDSTTRWNSRRKAEIVLAVHKGLITLEEACARYRLTVEEFASWQNAIEKHGVRALRTTTLQQYRHGESESDSAKAYDVPRLPNADRFAFTDDDVS